MPGCSGLLLFAAAQAWRRATHQAWPAGFAAVSVVLLQLQPPAWPTLQQLQLLLRLSWRPPLASGAPHSLCPHPRGTPAGRFKQHHSCLMKGEGIDGASLPHPCCACMHDASNKTCIHHTSSAPLSWQVCMARIHGLEVHPCSGPDALTSNQLFCRHIPPCLLACPACPPPTRL